MNALSSFYLNFALAPGTINNYKRVVKDYLLFCFHCGSTPWPVSEPNLIRFCSYLSRRVTADTIKNYLCAIRYFSILKGFDCSFRHMDRLYYVIRGIKRFQGVKANRPLRSPITTHHLILIHSKLQQLGFSPFERCMFWSASTLAFFGLLRVSEYTCSTIHNFNQSSDTSVNDISLNQNFLILTIKASKTDPFRRGCSIRIGVTNDLFCPVTAMRFYLYKRSLFPGPLFILQDGSFLTRARFMSMLVLTCNDPLITVRLNG